MTSAAVTALAMVACVASVAVLRGPSPERRLAGRRAGALPANHAVLALARRVLLRARRRRGDAHVAGALIESWAAQLRAGRPVGAALADALDDVGGARELLPRTSVALSVSGDVAVTMRLDAAAATEPNVRRSLVAAAACWSVARDNGGRMADALDRLGEGIRADHHHVAHVRAQLAGPRATARLLAALPVFALLLGTSLGMNPLTVLSGESIGRAALVVGLLLDGAGLWWTERMARTAERAA